MICPACEGDMFLPQYDEEGDLNHYSECWLCNGAGKVQYLSLPFRIKGLLWFSQAQEEKIIEEDKKESSDER